MIEKIIIKIIMQVRTKTDFIRNILLSNSILATCEKPFKHMQPEKMQISLHIQTVCSALCFFIQDSFYKLPISILEIICLFSKFALWLNTSELVGSSKDSLFLV